MAFEKVVALITFTCPVCKEKVETDIWTHTMAGTCYDAPKLIIYCPNTENHLTVDNEFEAISIE